MNAARRTPLIAAVPKIFFPFLVIAPGIVALGLTLHPNPGDAPLLPKVAILHLYPSDMAQNFWGAIVAWTTCLLVTLAISVMTRPKAGDELRGLVFGLTPRSDDRSMRWYERPAVLATVVLAVTLALNLIFW